MIEFAVIDLGTGGKRPAIVPPDPTFFNGSGSWDDDGQKRPVFTMATLDFDSSAPSGWSLRIDYQISYDDPTPVTWSGSTEWNGVDDIVAGVFAGTVDNTSTVRELFHIRYRAVIYRDGFDDVVGDWQNFAHDDDYDTVVVPPNLMNDTHFNGVTWYYSQQYVFVNGDSWSPPEEYGEYGVVQWRGEYDGSGSAFTDTQEATINAAALTLSLGSPMVAIGDTVRLRATPRRVVYDSDGIEVQYPGTELVLATDGALTPNIISDAGTGFDNPVLVVDETVAVGYAWSYTPNEGTLYRPDATFRIEYDDTVSTMKETVLDDTVPMIGNSTLESTGFTVTAGMVATSFYVSYSMPGIDLEPLASFLSTN